MPAKRSFFEFKNKQDSVTHQPEEEQFNDKVYADAFTFNKKSADIGNSSAQHLTACMYEQGKGVEKDMTMAFKYFKMSADQNNSNAQFNLYRLYDTGVGVDKNKDLAMEFLKLSAQNGHSSAKDVLNKLRRPLL